MPSRIEEPPPVHLHPPRIARNPSLKSTSSSIAASSSLSKASHRQPSSIFSFQRWTRRSSPNAENSSLRQTSFHPPNDSSLCPVCLRDLTREGVAELECGHNFHTNCIKSVTPVPNSLTLDPKMSSMWITLQIQKAQILPSKTYRTGTKFKTLSYFGRRNRASACSN
jgi:RING-type zinc-finger